MGIRKLHLDVFDEIDYRLVGIHTSIEDYRLAYLLNQALNLKLKRQKHDLEFGDASIFPIFQWYDDKKQVTWHLVANTCKLELIPGNQEMEDEQSLFSGNKTYFKTTYLLPEYKKVNYLLKIEDGQANTMVGQHFINQIQDIHHVITAYSIDASQLKSKNNLIFY
ncbi:IPExxxVDY family protein [Mangrovimonas spongiae]|uniref:IPExxxVDY family protein n=1 Tax=Mangrovimonas spongiae TaxID=2494697 RepID=A0A3R9MJ53_9FLAO|nr:IPExxxVDY family protein [Mangrovimonas spongiae]RSK41623.1 IPExxxVDY family protein [Mangrovimonas spongiae]